MLREFSIPLMAGVMTALLWCNFAPESYREFNYGHFWGSLSFHFITNDIFMAFFFAIAAVEITQSCLPGGDLSPLGKAVNPLLATIGGVAGRPSPEQKTGEKLLALPPMRRRPQLDRSLHGAPAPGPGPGLYHPLPAAPTP